MSHTTQPISLWNQIPWTLLLIVYLITTHINQIPLDGVVGYTFIGLGVVVLFIEFFKSGDVSATLFFIDQLSALISVMVATALLTFLFLVEHTVPNFFYWFGFAIILGDALLSPFNAYRTALRNFGVNGQ